MDATLVRIVCAVLAVAFLGLIVLRRRKASTSNGGASLGRGGRPEHVGGSPRCRPSGRRGKRSSAAGRGGVERVPEQPAREPGREMGGMV